MTAQDYRHAAEAFREIREHFLRTRLQRGERLSLSEAGFLYARTGERFNSACARAVAEVAGFVKAMRGLQELMGSRTMFPTGGMMVGNATGNTGLCR